ncbi:granulin [Schistosoma japonicum]|nr:granulin [Schistosoma japonicum]
MALVFAILIVYGSSVVHSNLCPQQCLPGSCCEVAPDDFRCCPYTNGMCCSDGKSCCPQGTKCGPKLGQCQSLDGSVFISKEISEKISSELRSDEFDVLYKILSPEHIVCPDRLSVCGDNTTCCPMSHEKWGCCKLTNAVCCPDGGHCCPHGSVCDMVHHVCKPPNFDEISKKDKLFDTLHLISASAPARLNPNVNPSKNSWGTKSQQSSAKYSMAYSGVVCPDPLFECPANTTCCRNSEGKWACCPVSPNLCSSSSSGCYKALHKSHGHLYNSQSSLYPVALTLNNTQLCPDTKSRCNDDQTCCKLKTGVWGCCPVENAVCCSDGEHCCPGGYVCDLSSQECTKRFESLSDNESKKLSLTTLLLPLPTKIGNNISCPNSDVYCTDNSTCCENHGTWQCCLFPNAVCCSDGIHCCPENTVCDLQAEVCVANDASSNTIVSKIQSKSTPKLDHNSHISVCPDNKSICFNSRTCCPGKNDQSPSLCCPHENAVCCGDGKHCCPEGTVCDMTNGSCIRHDDSSRLHTVPLLNKITALHVNPKGNSQSSNSTKVCPGGTAKCPDSSTCCKLSYGQYACCPIRDAVCCADGIHCCPSGTTCDYKTLSCVKTNTENNHSVRSVDPSDEFLRNPKLLFVGAVDHLCPDHQSTCTKDHSCCQLLDKSWGCCPLKNGICCSDHFHCCPAGSVCDLESKRCILHLDNNNQSTRKIVSDAFIMPKSVLTSSDSLYSRPIKSIGSISVKAKWCGACGDNWACCPDISFNSWSCCPYVGGECCIGQNTCCPPGSRCLANGKCERVTESNILKSFAPALVPSIPMNNTQSESRNFIKQNSEQEIFGIRISNASRPARKNVFLLYQHYRRLKLLLHTICPDSLHYCAKSEQCCLSNKFGYTCAPEKSKCCEPNMDTYCSASTECSLDGVFCV